MFLHPEKIITQFHIGKGMKVAEFGVGNGSYTIPIAAHVGTDGVVYACDIQKDLLQRIDKEAKAKGYENIHLIHCDFEEDSATSLPDASIDVVVLANILFQIKSKHTCVQEALRILRRGGRLLILDWSASQQGIGPTQDHVFPMSEAKILLEKEECIIEREIDAGSHHYGIIARRRDD